MELHNIELYAWMGEDEFGSGKIGIKQGLVPAGFIPLVGIDREKMLKLYPQMNEQARQYGKKISLYRFVFANTEVSTTEGQS